MAYLPINSPKSARSYLVNKRIWYNKFFMNQKHVYNINHNLEPNPSSISTKPCKRKPVNFFWQVGPRQHRDSGTHWPPTVFFTWYGGNPWTVQKPLHGLLREFLREFLRRFFMPFSGGIPLNRSFSVLNRSEPFRNLYMGCYVSSYVSFYVGFSCLFQGGIPLNRSFSVLNRSGGRQKQPKTT